MVAWAPPAHWWQAAAVSGGRLREKGGEIHLVTSTQARNLTDALEIHDDALDDKDRVLLIDDVLATGGTAAAASCLIRDSGATLVGAAVLIELSFLEGRKKLDRTTLHSVIQY